MSATEETQTVRAHNFQDQINAGSPSHIWIEPTNRCNTRCVHCGHFYEQFGEDMEFALFEKVRDHLLSGVQRVELIGYGEPLMAKYFWQMFDECAARDIEIYITSNGILLRDDSRVSRLVRTRMTLCLSIDGATKETFESVRPYIKWHKMQETLECISRNALAAGEERKFQFRFNFVAMKRNIAELPALVELAHKYGATEIFVLPLGFEELFPKVNGESLHSSPELVVPAFERAIQLSRQHHIVLHIPYLFKAMLDSKGNSFHEYIRFFRRKIELATYNVGRYGVVNILRNKISRTQQVLSPTGGSYCNMPWNDAYFASDGRVFPCCILSEDLGNMHKQSWEEIWNGSPYQNLRRTMHSWNPTKACRTCPLPIGLNGGDEHAHDRYFAKFSREDVPLDSTALQFPEGFHDLETLPGGGFQRWLEPESMFKLNLSAPGRFLCLTIAPHAPVRKINPGIARINGGKVEPFDNSCAQIFLPIGELGTTLEIELELEEGHRVPGDARLLAMPLRGVSVLR